MGFATTFSALRRQTGLSQRQAAAELGISQALLSHYENGLREPRLEFVVKACAYYGVSADYMLGRTENRGAAPGEVTRAGLLAAECCALETIALACPRGEESDLAQAALKLAEAEYRREPDAGRDAALQGAGLYAADPAGAGHRARERMRRLGSEDTHD